jgi:hypothetical protein
MDEDIEHVIEMLERALKSYETRVAKLKQLVYGCKTYRS